MFKTRLTERKKNFEINKLNYAITYTLSIELQNIFFFYKYINDCRLNTSRWCKNRSVSVWVCVNSFQVSWLKQPCCRHWTPVRGSDITHLFPWPDTLAGSCTALMWAMVQTEHQSKAFESTVMYDGLNSSLLGPKSPSLSLSLTQVPTVEHTQLFHINVIC